MSTPRGLALTALLLGLVACSGGGSAEPPLAEGGSSASADGGAAAGPSDGGVSGSAEAGDGGTDMGQPEPLTANPGAARYALVGEEVLLDGSASQGAQRFRWNFGNGSGWNEPRPEARATVSYDSPGRYHAVLTVYDELGRQRSAEALISVTYPAEFTLRGSATLTPLSSGTEFAVVSPDSDELVVLSHNGDDFAVSRRLSTAKHPRTVVEWQGWLAVACQDDHVVELHDAASGAKQSLAMPAFSAPYGVADGGDFLYVSLQATGQLAVVALGAGDVPKLLRVVEGAPDARGVAALPDGRVAVTRFRSPDERAEVSVIDPIAGSSVVLSLAFDPQLASDAESGGVPSYLAAFVVSPTGRDAIVPSLIANIADGAYKNERPLTFETTVRATLSRVDLLALEEQFDERIQFDDLGLAVAATFSAHGDFAFVAMPANRQVRRVDLLNRTQAGSFIDAGYAPDGVLLTPDDRFLLVTSYLSRELDVYDLQQFPENPTPSQRLSLVPSEPLTDTVLRGKQLFNDAADPRLAKSGYIACASCHFDGDSDARVWDFTDRGEGLRNTISLLGSAGEGPLHWSGNFDEVQDFEHDIRSAFGGTGLLADADFHFGSRDRTLGDPKAGLSADLDALSAYVSSLGGQPPSPFRDEGGALPPAAARGKLIFESSALGCTTCHQGPRLTDSKFAEPGEPLLHDVGTLSPASGKRLNQALPGIDTPTLHGLWSTAPYLHDGSATTLRDVVRTRNPADLHGKTSQLSEPEVADLAAYLLCLDGSAD